MRKLDLKLGDTLYVIRTGRRNFEQSFENFTLKFHEVPRFSNPSYQSMSNLIKLFSYSHIIKFKSLSSLFGNSYDRCVLSTDMYQCFKWYTY